MGTQLGRQRVSAHFRQFHVGEEQVDAGFERVDQFQRFLGAARLQHVEPGGVQTARDGLQNRGLIFDHQRHAA